MRPLPTTNRRGFLAQLSAVVVAAAFIPALKRKGPVPPFKLSEWTHDGKHFLLFNPEWQKAKYEIVFCHQRRESYPMRFEKLTDALYHSHKSNLKVVERVDGTHSPYYGVMYD